MSIIIIIAIIILSILALILFIKYIIFTHELIRNFERCNVLVAGKKGTGKDLLFQYVINHRKKTYYANLDYGGRYENIKLKQVSCAPNDYDNIVNDKIEKQPHTIIDGKDIYISDIGVFLPSYMDSKLYVKFPSMPVFYALSRHLYNNNIHCNTQNIERGWKALREQADYYVITRKTWRIFGLLITKMTTYDRYQSAKDNVRPIKSRILNKFSKAQVDLYHANTGEIKEGYIIQRISKLKYDTRAFEKILLTGDRLTENDNPTPSHSSN